MRTSNFAIMHIKLIPNLFHTGENLQHCLPFTKKAPWIRKLRGECGGCLVRD